VLAFLRRPTGTLALCLAAAALANVAVPYMHTVVHGLEAFVAAFAVLLVARLSSRLEAREAELKEAHARAARTERMASLTALAAGAAHELNTPLGTIAVVAKELETHATTPAIIDDARLLRSEVERCRAILRDLGSPTGEASARIPVHDLVTDVLARLPDAERARVAVRYEPGADAVAAPRIATTHALTGLVRNALEAIPQRGVVVGVGTAGDRVQFAVKDSGAGIAPEVLAHAGEPFFSTKPEGRGLGLWLARQLAEGLGGKLWIESEAGQGTTVLVDLPRAQAEVRA
jgi:two-component system sensor histidine kinase RegB